MISQGCKQAVILLHGLGANRFAMLRLAKSLSANGYHVANWGYASTRSSIEVHAKAFQRRLDQFLNHAHYDRVHLVTHSMGGIVARRAFSPGGTHSAKIGRVIMLSPPNSGSHVARWLAGPLGWLCPPLIELSDAPDSYVNRLQEPHEIELGIVAAAYDRVLHLQSTHLACQRDHIVIAAHHGALPWSRETVKQVLHFLRHGRFHHSVT